MSDDFSGALSQVDLQAAERSRRRLHRERAEERKRVGFAFKNGIKGFKNGITDWTVLAATHPLGPDADRRPTAIN